MGECAGPIPKVEVRDRVAADIQTPKQDENALGPSTSLPAPSVPWLRLGAIREGVDVE